MNALPIGTNKLKAFIQLLLMLFGVGATLFFPFAPTLSAQDDDTATAPQSSSPDTNRRVEVKPASSDPAIARRLTRILNSTDWFEKILVSVNEGVVFLDGQTTSERYRAWAGDLAGRTQDVVAVVNRIRLVGRVDWNFSPAIEEIDKVMQQSVRFLPMIGLSLVILLVSMFAAKIAAAGMRSLLSHRLNPMILGMAARGAALFTFLVGLYLVLRVAGLTRLAATVIGGTVIAGLVAGIAFRDILENYLASVLISLRNPFRLGDIVQIGEHHGVVQRVTSRGTVLMDMNGNHIQIPNATVYKSIIQNYTANPNRRDAFTVGIGYDNDVVESQRIALEVLENHPTVLREPEPLVLADFLGAATVTLKVYYWYDGTTRNGLKIKSSLIRNVKTAFEDRGISMPDEAREIVFPQGVPVELKPEGRDGPAESRRVLPVDRDAESGQPLFVEAEGDQTSEAESIQKQARQSRNPEESPDLIAEPVRDPNE
jgi:small-conductance mechanosensitive channel